MYNSDNEENLNYMKEDKILNNSFNTGCMEYQHFISPIKIDDKVSQQYEDISSENMTKQITIKMLNDELYTYFEQSKYFNKYKVIKRVDKTDMIDMFYLFKNKLLKSTKFSNAEIFMGFCEFFQINYEFLYTNISVLDKELLLKELTDTYTLNKKIKVAKLF